MRINLAKGDIMAHAGGRPTKYKKEYCKSIIKFFSKPLTKIVNGKEVVNDLPFLAEYARSIGVTHETLHQWRDRYPEFFAAYNEAKELQKQFLIKNTLNGHYQQAFAIFTAKNITDMRDTQHVDQTNRYPDKIEVNFEA